jgi:hypothetical protein
MKISDYLPIGQREYLKPELTEMVKDKKADITLRGGKNRSHGQGYL